MIFINIKFAEKVFKNVIFSTLCFYYFGIVNKRHIPFSSEKPSSYFLIYFLFL